MPLAAVFTTRHLQSTDPPTPQVDAVPLPCSNLTTLANEVTKPLAAGCTLNPATSVSSALLAPGRTHFLQLLIATGLLRMVDETSLPFTILAPSDAALESAATRGGFKYGELFATDKAKLQQIVGYHVGTKQALPKPPSAADAVARIEPNLMGGDAGCGAAAEASWGADGLVRGGRGVARATEVLPGGCPSLHFFMSVFVCSSKNSALSNAHCTPQNSRTHPVSPAPAPAPSPPSRPLHRRPD